MFVGVEGPTSPWPRVPHPSIGGLPSVRVPFPDPESRYEDGNGSVKERLRLRALVSFYPEMPRHPKSVSGRKTRLLMPKLDVATSSHMLTSRSAKKTSADFYGRLCLRLPALETRGSYGWLPTRRAPRPPASDPRCGEGTSRRGLRPPCSRRKRGPMSALYIHEAPLTGDPRGVASADLRDPC